MAENGFGGIFSRINEQRQRGQDRWKIENGTPPAPAPVPVTAAAPMKPSSSSGINYDDIIKQVSDYIKRPMPAVKTGPSTGAYDTSQYNDLKPLALGIGETAKRITGMGSPAFANPAPVVNPVTQPVIGDVFRDTSRSTGIGPFAQPTFKEGTSAIRTDNNQAAVAGIAPTMAPPVTSEAPSAPVINPATGKGKTFEQAVAEAKLRNASPPLVTPTSPTAETAPKDESIPSGWGIVGQGYKSGANAWGDNPSGKGIGGVASINDPTMTVARRTVGKDGVPLLEARGIGNPSYDASLAPKSDQSADLNAAIDAIRKDPGSQLVGGKGLNSKAIAAITELEKAKGVNANTAVTQEQNRINQENLNIYRQGETERRTATATERTALKTREDWDKRVKESSPKDYSGNYNLDIGRFNLGLSGTPIHPEDKPAVDRMMKEFGFYYTEFLKKFKLEDTPTNRQKTAEKYKKDMLGAFSLPGLQ